MNESSQRSAFPTIAPNPFSITYKDPDNPNIELPKEDDQNL